MTYPSECLDKAYKLKEYSIQGRKNRKILRNLYSCVVIFCSGQYEKQYYINQYPDFVKYCLSQKFWKYRNSSFFPLKVLCQILYHPVVHYVFRGVYEGKDLVDDFDSVYYILKYPSFLEVGGNPYSDYIIRGRKNGCSPIPEVWSHADFLEKLNPENSYQDKKQNASIILQTFELSGSYVLILQHEAGGGAEAYLEEILISKLKKEFEYIVVARPNPKKKSRCFELTIIFEDAVSKIYENRNLNLLDFKPQKIIINNLGYYKPELLENIMNFLIEFSGGIQVLFHDFFYVCPSIVLVNENHNCCRVESCRNCSLFKKDFILSWRHDWQYIFDKAEKITFFSKSSYKIIEEVYKFNKDNIVIEPHEPLITYSDNQKYQFNNEHGLVIGFVGSVNEHKGGDIIVRMARENPDTKFIIVGSVGDEYRVKIDDLENVKVTGRYELEALPNVLRKEHVSITSIASVWPETFCYVLQELMQLEYPVVAFNLGAQGEKTAQYKYGMLADEITSQSMFTCVKELYADIVKREGF